MTISSFSPESFSPLSFTVESATVPTPQPGTTTGKRNRFRAWVLGWARTLRDFFKIKQRPPEPEDVPIPKAQPPKIFHILPGPPTAETKLETLNDKWLIPRTEKPPLSAVASIPPVYYPMILNPLTSPLIQTKVTLPRATRSTSSLPPYMVGEGSHIESQSFTMTKPKNRAKAASTINTLMLLLEIERQV